MHAEAQAYTAGWYACMAGEDGRFTNPYPLKDDAVTHLAWCQGFVDAMEADDGEEPDPVWAGYDS